MNKVQRQQLVLQKIDALGNELTIDDIVLLVDNNKLIRGQVIDICYNGIEVSIYKNKKKLVDAKQLVKLYLPNLKERKWLKFILNK